MKPLQISIETAQMLAKQLKMPVEHILHMPKHILVQKLTELTKSTEASSSSDAESNSDSEQAAPPSSQDADPTESSDS